MKNVRIDHFPPGYDPTRDHIPPRQAKLAPFITCGVMLLVAVFGVGAAISYFTTRHKQDVAAAMVEKTPESTSEATLDAWGATGTALYWQTFTPTATYTETPTPTMEMSETPTASPTADNWHATGTAIFITLSGAYETTLEAAPSSLAAQTAAALPTSRVFGSMNNTSPFQPTARPQIVVVTRESPPVVVTRIVPVPVPVVITATSRPEMTLEPQPLPTLVLPSVTFSPTPSETLVSATPTPSETPTETPAATQTPETPSPTFTDAPTWTPTPSETPTEFPTDSPTEA